MQTLPSYFHRPLPILWGIVVMFTAAYLRLHGLTYSPIGGDQSILLSIALRFVNQGLPMLPLAANKSSAGIMNPPLIEYLLALPLWIQKTLTAVHLFQALLSILAVLLLYVVAYHLFGGWVAVSSSLLFAVAPWAVYYGRFIWNPNPIPFFSTLLLISLLICCTTPVIRPTIFLPLSFLWLAAITQLHLSSFVMIPVVTLVLVIFYRQWHQKQWWQTTAVLMTGLLLVLLLYLPFIIYERAVGFTDLQAFAAALSGNQQTLSGEIGTPEINLASWLITAELTTGNGILPIIQTPPGAIWPWFGLTRVAHIVFILSLLYGLVAPLLWQMRHKGQPLPSRQTALFITAIWILLPVFLYLRQTIYLQNYYFLYIFPAPFLLIALTIDSLFASLPLSRLTIYDSQFIRQLTPYLLFSPLFLFCFWQFHLMHTYTSSLETQQMIGARPFIQLQNAIYHTQNILSQHPSCDLAIVTEGGTAETSDLSLMESFIYPHPVRFIDRGQGYIIPASCMIYLLAGQNLLVENWLAEIGTPLAEPIQLEQETWYFFYVAETADSPSPPLATWQNGLWLSNAQTTGQLSANNELTIQYTWYITEVPASGVRYHFFNHLLDENGQLVAQVDAPAIDNLYWRLGDQIVTEFYLPLPGDLKNGRYTLMVGLYTWPDLQRILLIDGQSTYPVVKLQAEGN